MAVHSSLSTYTVTVYSFSAATVTVYTNTTTQTVLAINCDITHPLQDIVAFAKVVNGASESDPSNNPSLPDIGPVTASLTHQVWKHDGEIRVNVAFEVRSNEHNMNNFFSLPDIAWNILY